jgi:hypothetical protein
MATVEARTIVKVQRSIISSGREEVMVYGHNDDKGTYMGPFPRWLNPYMQGPHKFKRYFYAVWNKKLKGYDLVEAVPNRIANTLDW